MTTECLSDGGFLQEGRGAVKGYEGDKSVSLRHVFDIWQGGLLTGKFVHGFISYREERQMRPELFIYKFRELARDSLLWINLSTMESL